MRRVRCRATVCLWPDMWVRLSVCEYGMCCLFVVACLTHHWICTSPIGSIALSSSSDASTDMTSPNKTTEMCMALQDKTAPLLPVRFCQPSFHCCFFWPWHGCPCFRRCPCHRPCPRALPPSGRRPSCPPPQCGRRRRGRRSCAAASSPACCRLLCQPAKARTGPCVPCLIQLWLGTGIDGRNRCYKAILCLQSIQSR